MAVSDIVSITSDLFDITAEFAENGAAAYASGGVNLGVVLNEIMVSYDRRLELYRDPSLTSLPSDARYVGESAAFDIVLAEVTSAVRTLVRGTQRVKRGHSLHESNYRMLVIRPRDADTYADRFVVFYRAVCVRSGVVTVHSEVGTTEHERRRLSILALEHKTIGLAFDDGAPSSFYEPPEPEP